MKGGEWMYLLTRWTGDTSSWRVEKFYVYDDLKDMEQFFKDHEFETAGFVYLLDTVPVLRVIAKSGLYIIERLDFEEVA